MMKESKGKLMTGDLKRIAEALGVDYQRVRNVNIGRTKDELITKTIEKLKNSRTVQAEEVSDKAVSSIINL